MIKKDIQENIIYVSRGYGVKTQYGNELRINDFHFITDNPWQSAGKEIDITFKIRHTPEFTKGKLVQEGERQFRILSSEKLQGIAPDSSELFMMRLRRFAWGVGKSDEELLAGIDAVK